MLEISLAASSLLLEIARLVMRFGCFLFLSYLLAFILSLTLTSVVPKNRAGAAQAADPANQGRHRLTGGSAEQPQPASTERKDAVAQP